VVDNGAGLPWHICRLPVARVPLLAVFTQPAHEVEPGGLVRHKLFARLWSLCAHLVHAVVCLVHVGPEYVVWRDVARRGVRAVRASILWVPANPVVIVKLLAAIIKLGWIIRQRKRPAGFEHVIRLLVRRVDPEVDLLTRGDVDHHVREHAAREAAVVPASRKRLACGRVGDGGAPIGGADVACIGPVLGQVGSSRGGGAGPGLRGRRVAPCAARSLLESRAALFVAVTGTVGVGALPPAVVDLVVLKIGLAVRRLLPVARAVVLAVAGRARTLVHAAGRAVAQATRHACLAAIVAAVGFAVPNTAHVVVPNCEVGEIELQLRAAPRRAHGLDAILRTLSIGDVAKDLSSPRIEEAVEDARLR